MHSGERRAIGARPRCRNFCAAAIRCAMLNRSFLMSPALPIAFERMTRSEAAVSGSLDSRSGGNDRVLLFAGTTRLSTSGIAHSHNAKTQFLFLRNRRNLWLLFFFSIPPVHGYSN